MVDKRRNTQEQAPKDEYVLSLKSFVGVVWKRLWLVALAAIVLGGAVVGASILQTPQYEASARILVGQGQSFTDSPNNTLGFQQLTQTMATAAESQRIYEPIIERFDLGMSPDEFESRFSAGQVSATQFLEITYEDSDAETARRVVNALAEEFSEQIADSGEGESPISATVWSEADTPTEPVSPEPVRDGVLALLVGGMLGVGVAFLLEFFDDSWGSPEEAERISGVPTFGIIPKFDLSSSKKPFDGGDPERYGEAAYAGASAGGPREEGISVDTLAEIGYQEVSRDEGEIWPVGIVVLDAKGRVREVNPTVERMLGVPGGELRGEAIQSLASHPDDVEGNAGLQAELAKGKRDHYQLEKRLVKKDGQLMWSRLTVSRVRHMSGKARFLVGMFEDISAQKQLEERLRLSVESRRHSNERLRAIVGVAPLIVHSFTPDGFSLMSNESNDAWDRFWHAGEETNGANLFDDERLRSAGLTPYIEKSVKGGDVVTTPTLHYEKPRNGAPGAERWVNAFIHPLRDEVGRVAEVIVMLEDVTERKQAEEELRERSADGDNFEQELQKAREEQQKLEEHLRHNIAARKRAEKALRESEGEFRSLIRFAAVMFSKEKKER